MLKGFLGANVADAISSAQALLYGGAEANPLIATGIHYIGMEPTLILKLAVAMVIGAILMKAGKARLLKWPTAIIAIAAISNSIQALVL